MSFFSAKPGAGGTSTTGTGSNSLFGSLNLDTSVPSTADPLAGGKRKSIFESSSTTEARSKPTMFSNLGGASSTPGTSAAAPGMFGSTTTTQPASTGTGMFGSATATSGAAGTGAGGGFSFFNKAANTAPATGLFSGNAGADAGASTTTKPSLFGQTNPPTTAAQNTTSTNAFGSTFGQIPAASTLGGAGATQPQNPGQQDEAKAQNRESVYFNGLLERQKKKIKFSSDQSGQLGQLPSMNMDLGDLARRAQELGQKNQKLGQSSARDSRAHYLLSGSGVTPGQAYKDFQKLDGDVPVPPAQSRIDFAEEGSAYLRGMQAKGREAMLRESMDRVYRDVDAFIEESLGINFDEQKKRIMQHFGLTAKDAGDDVPASGGSFGQSKSPSKNKSSRRSIFGRSGLDKSMIGNATSVAGSSSFFSGQASNAPTSLSKNQTIRDLRDKERIFMQKVEALNRSRVEERNYKILHEFKEVENGPGDVPKQLIDAYSALEEITKENTTENGLRERLFANAHAQSTNPANSVNLKKQILEGSRRFLEKSFYRELEEMVQKNPRSAQLGGQPTVINKVRAYIRVRQEKHDLAPDGAELTQIGDNGDYCWIVIFYLLRSGHIQQALEYVNSDSAFQSVDRRFVSFLASYASNNGRLGQKLQDMINGVYQQLTRVAPKDTVDPYRVACLKVVGRCDQTQRNLESIGQGVEDWLWLQFALARESETPDDAMRAPFGLEQIAETVREIGDKHFQKGQVEAANSYGTFFLMQTLAGMFEQAVDYLHSFNPVSAVHAAIALDYYGLLRISDFQTAGNELLTFATTGEPQLNFVPLIAYYTTTFRAALPVQSVDYLALICLNSDLPKPLGESTTNACHECLRELCLETREFAALLGDIRGDGSRIPGAIEQRARVIRLDSHEQFLRFITSQAAAVADSRGQIADAVLLYHLCDDYDNVTTVLNRALADAVAVELGDEPISIQPLKPRNNVGASGSDTASQTSQQPNSSLSLTQSTSSALELAKNMTSLYDSNAVYFSRISNQNRSTCKVLMMMLSARAKIEHPTNPEYLRALEELNSTGIIPLDSRGDIPTIRQMATSFSGLPQLVARCAGLVILWCVRAIGAERERVAREGTWGIPGASEDDLNQLKGQLSQMAKDLMVFAGLVRYKLPGRVYDLLTRAGGDVGGY
ncbi:nuclear pore complex subunit [Knufia fluminis]|uniref:Nuclear pore complex subunit n=1 Tax=Knufia fluminis TaxID=191047 RepID=A0AAN8IIU1_9EURO|nr:nuclear pore complex subunit [Knufia fluminis]